MFPEEFFTFSDGLKQNYPKIYREALSAKN